MRPTSSGLLVARSGRITDQDLRVYFIVVGVFVATLSTVMDIEAIGMQS